MAARKSAQSHIAPNNTSSNITETAPAPDQPAQENPAPKPILRDRNDCGSHPNADTKLRADYIRRVERLGAKLGKRPTQPNLRNLAGIRDDHTLRLFGNYAALFRAAGFRSQVRGKFTAQISSADILHDFHKVIARIGHFPTVAEYLKQGGGYSYNLVMRHFGAWWRVRLALENRSGHDSNWPANPRDPSTTFGDSLPASLSGSDLAPRLAGLSIYTPTDDRPVCGRVLNHRAMLHQPTNEQGVVLLFGMMAEEMGFIIENVRTAYPDCEGKRRVGPDSWQRVRIEFEYLSSRFNHPKEGCDLIICWRNDHPVKGLEIIALEQVIHDIRARQALQAPSPAELPKVNHPTTQENPASHTPTSEAAPTQPTQAAA
ncbi:MAG: hypothetical protein J0L78_14645 [Planctomycetes bacterium]|nr:hypothetical protein [Planctomycetota bacterium]